MFRSLWHEQLYMYMLSAHELVELWYYSLNTADFSRVHTGAWFLCDLGGKQVPQFQQLFHFLWPIWNASVCFSGLCEFTLSFTLSTPSKRAFDKSLMSSCTLSFKCTKPKRWQHATVCLYFLLVGRKQKFPVVNQNVLIDWIRGSSFFNVLSERRISIESKLLLRDHVICCSWAARFLAAGDLSTADSCRFNLNTYLFCCVCVSINP